MVRLSLTNNVFLYISPLHEYLIAAETRVRRSSECAAESDGAAAGSEQSEARAPGLGQWLAGSGTWDETGDEGLMSVNIVTDTQLCLYLTQPQSRPQPAAVSAAQLLQGSQYTCNRSDQNLGAGEREREMGTRTRLTLR